MGTEGGALNVDDVALDLPRVFARPLPRPGRRHLQRRAWNMGKVVARHFGPLALAAARKQALAGTDVAKPLRRTFEDLGATFMKFGQLIGSSPGVFGDEVSDEFRSCLDTGPAVPFDEVRRTIEVDLGLPLADAFAEIEEQPIGRASIAVVHRAHLHDGRVVAVKVLRPNIENRVATDLDLLEPLVNLVARQTGDQMAGSLVQLLDGFREQMGEELDLRNERRSMEHARVLLGLVDLPLVIVPRTVPELSGARVLTMEFIDGVPVDDLASLQEFGYDARPIIEQVVRGWLLTAVRWGTFHGDVHAGNLLLTPDGRIAVLDWGIVGRLDPETHFFFRRLIEGALGDETAWDDIAAHVQKTYGSVIQDGLGLDDDQLAAFIRSMLEPILTQPFGEVSLAMLIQGPQEQAARARGLVESDRSLAGTLRRIREQRRLYRMVEAQGTMETDFDRATFLLSKQLMYFERYGKMFLADASLFEDRAFFEKLLAESPALERPT
jgi:predicted unusual protein kinase regulating ubiquinone biosynthesis (AarF/ABC1/UbiB family)